MPPACARAGRFFGAAGAPGVSRIELRGLAATQALAARVAALAKRGDTIALEGPLGAGKTSFARFFIAALAQAEGRAIEEVPSPTFTLVQTYEFARFTVHHFDLYRIADAREALELGLEDALADGVCLIEWPEKLGPYLPADRLHVALALTAAPDVRMAEIEAFGSWRERWR
jgi:tRNA threonylcarbamoyladenosine biosynthesis protein TsaE